MELMVGLAIVDQLDGERRTRRMAAGWMGMIPAPGRRMRTALAAALLVLAGRVAPALPQAEFTYPRLADAADS